MRCVNLMGPRLRIPICLFFLICRIGAAAAETMRPETHNDTLTLLRKAYLAREEVSSAIVNPEEDSLVVKLKEGTESTAYPDNLHLQLRSAETPAERDTILETFVSATVTPYPVGVPIGPPDPAHILPVIRPTAFTSGVSQAPGLLALPFAADLSVYFVVDLPQAMTYVNQDGEAAPASRTDDLLRLAKRNLAALPQKPMVEGDGPYFIVLDGNYEASILLDTDFWKRQDQALGDIIAAPIARDLVLFADRSVPGQEDFVRDLVGKYVGQVDHPLTDRLLHWDGSGWTELTE